MPPLKLNRTSLGTAGLDHVKSRLWSNLPLGRALGERPLEQGEAWTWAAPGANLTLADLRDGDLTPSERDSHQSLLMDFVVEYLATNGTVVIIEDHEATPDDPWLATEPDLPPSLPRLGFGEHLYWFAVEPKRELVADLMRWGFGLFKCMALAQSTDRWPPATELTATDIAGLGRQADHVVVDAFDFDGFVIWSRGPGSV
jgi:hypothetical protein